MLLSRGFPCHRSTYAYVGLYVPRVVDTAITQRARSPLEKGEEVVQRTKNSDRQLVFRSILHTLHDREAIPAASMIRLAILRGLSLSTGTVTCQAVIRQERERERERCVKNNVLYLTFYTQH